MAYKNDLEGMGNIRNSFNDIHSYLDELTDFAARFEEDDEESLIKLMYLSSGDVIADLTNIEYDSGSSDYFIFLFDEFKEHYKNYYTNIDEYLEEEFPDYYLEQGDSGEMTVNDKYEEFKQLYLSFFEQLFFKMLAFEKKFIQPQVLQQSAATSLTKFEPIRLTDRCLINEIPTVFYKLFIDQKLNTTKTNIIRVLSAILRDKDGNELKESTLKDIFNNSKVGARSKKV